MDRLGNLISLEGGDGSGKSTVAQKIWKQLKHLNIPSILVDPKRSNFTEDYIAKHMKTLSTILWEQGLSGPRHLLSDYHWVYLAASWFNVLDQHLIKPALAYQQIVIVDSWYHKLLARFQLKEPNLFAEAKRCFKGLEKPDLTCMLDVDPVLAANRKTEFGYAETGNFDGLKGVNRENFIIYQNRVRMSLLEMARHESWETIVVDHIDSHDVAKRIINIMHCRGFLLKQ